MGGDLSEYICEAFEQSLGIVPLIRLCRQIYWHVTQEDKPMQKSVENTAVFFFENLKDELSIRDNK